MDTASGQVSVKMLRFSCPVTGDKVATGHGQKGVIKLWEQEEMPWGVDNHGQPIYFDIVVALSSIVNRLTVGEYYEMVSGANSAMSGRRLVVNPYAYHNEHKETVLYDGRTGKMIERLGDPRREKSAKQYRSSVPVYSSWGICRVWQMTQMTWDKQHYTHNTAGKFSTTTLVARAAGGGIRLGEMESHAIKSSGLTSSLMELKSRMDLLDV
ncbi:hypothetical protein F4803DRAFT_557869 [Xylaria telfairii]|nr:hypothetical protein F4803DRAFT_557869 [Xylaria telfairii]